MDTLPYLEFCLAQTRHQQALGALPPELRDAIHAEALRQWRLEERILGTPQAQALQVDAAAVSEAVATLCARYPDQESWRADLLANGLNETLLAAALERELRVESVLAEISRQAPTVTVQDAEGFYQAHRERFFLPEAYQARHILITIQEDSMENSAAAAQARAAEIAARLAQAPERFADEALRHSECPTALQGGGLGWVQRGQLYPELDAVLFSMVPEEIRIAQSPLGLHVLYCEAIRVAGVQPFDAIADKLMASLQTQQVKKLRMAWIKTLMAN